MVQARNMGLEAVQGDVEIDRPRAVNDQRDIPAQLAYGVCI